MKSLRGYFVTSLIALVAALTLVACSKDEGAGGPGCPAGFIAQNGTCVYDPNNPGSGGGTYPPGGYGFIPNGDINDGSHFRDLVRRLTGVYYYCVTSYPYSCDDIQTKVQKINDSQYYIYVTFNTGNGLQTIAMTGTKFTYDDEMGMILEVRYGNPYNYVIAELDLGADLTSTSSHYVLTYLDNSGDRFNVATGLMSKGTDYN